VTAIRETASYGIDAPPAVVGLALGGLCLFALAVFLPDARLLAVPATVLVAEAGLMVWGSRAGKPRFLARVLDAIPWRGDEQVLDVGCGRGVMLIAAARRLSTGTAHGVDIWNNVDQSGNSRAATERNARAEGVADRVAVHDGDARKLPFPDRSFDVIVSSLALHNIHPAKERAVALREIARVLRPGGRVAIVDVRSTRQYAHVLAECGLRDVTCSGLTFRTFPPLRVVTGTKPG
jgi:SAM-dependent methyltransferase